MAIELPRAGAGSVGSPRVRTGRLPNAGDVPQVRVAADPGLQVPDFASAAGGLGDIGGVLSDFGAIVEHAADKQQKRHDATETGNALLDLERFLTDDLRDRQTKDNAARPGFMTDHEDAGSEQLKKIIAGLDGVSEEAVEALRLRMRAALESSVGGAGRLSLQAGQQAASDAADKIINQGSQQAERDPDFLDVLLDQLDERLEPFEDTSTADQERDRLSDARREYILSAVAGFVKQGRLQDAELLLASGKFDEDLTRANVASAEAMIEAGRREERLEAERARKAADRELKLSREATADNFLDRTFNPDLAPLNYRDVLASNLTPTQQATFINLMDKEQRREETDLNAFLYNGLFQRIAAGQLTAEGLIDEALGLVGNGLRPEDVKALRTFAQEVEGDLENQPRKNFFDFAKSQMTGTNDFFSDPDGDKLYFEFTNRYRKLVAEEKAKGKTLLQLLDPDSPDYIGSKLIVKRTQAEMLAAQAEKIRKMLTPLNQTPDQ